MRNKNKNKNTNENAGVDRKHGSVTELPSNKSRKEDTRGRRKSERTKKMKQVEEGEEKVVESRNKVALQEKSVSTKWLPWKHLADQLLEVGEVLSRKKKALP